MSNHDNSFSNKDENEEHKDEDEDEGILPANEDDFIYLDED